MPTKLCAGAHADKEVVEKNDECYNEEQVNQEARYVQDDEAEQPENYQDDYDSPENTYHA